MSAVACAALGYLIGTINPAFLFSKTKGFDIRERGSGNAGATNVMLTVGKLAGVLCALLDILKAFLAYRLGRRFFPMLQFAGILAGACCILGHIFPVWMGFQGGKGLACIGGVILAHSWKLFVVMLIFEIALTLIINYICAMAMSTCTIFTAIYAVTTHDWIGTIALVIVTIVVHLKHVENMKRIMQGTEFHVSYLWDKESEIKRVTDILGDDRVHELV